MLQVTDDLKNFLTTNLPKVKKDGKAKFKLGVAEAKLGSAIQVLAELRRSLPLDRCRRSTAACAVLAAHIPQRQHQDAQLPARPQR